MTRKPTKAVAYLRVSTDQQGRSGLGLDAQREAVARYAQDAGLEIVAEYVEVETGKGANALAKRPELLAALTLAKREKAKLIIAKLDRLARNVHFVSGLMEKGVDFGFADMPSANKFMLHVYAAVAEKEGEVISQRTKAALAAAKAKGVKLGTHGKVLAAKNKFDAAKRVAAILPELEQMKTSGLTMRAMVADLNARGVASPGGGRWHLASLHKALQRIETKAA